MPGIAANRHTARELAQLGGITERTVRYYVHERLIDPPDGRGRGAHFDDRHLTQLRRVRLLQEAGLENAAIRQYGADLESALARRGIRLKDAERSWANFTLEAMQAYRIHRHGFPLGNVGHTSQLPHAEVERILTMDPQFVTVYTLEAAERVSEACVALGQAQLKAGRTVEGRKTLASAAQEAKSKGLGLIEKRALAASKAS